MTGSDVLIVMTRLPCEGRNKTRLIPVLGAAGATALHDRLARHTLSRVNAFIMRSGARLQVYLDGGSPEAGRAWLGDVECFEQSEGDLGKRMQTAVECAFSEGARRVVVIGTDCPSIDEDILKDAFQSMEAAEIVFGPAVDGGYYLLGMSRPCDEVFTGIDWGSGQVLEQSVAAAGAAGCRTVFLTELRDVDVADDLEAAELVLGGRVS